MALTPAHLALSALALLSTPSLVTADKIWASYVFHRHGDRTAKAWPPANLTDLGYNQVYDAGSYYRSRYLTSSSSSSSDTVIAGMNQDIVLQSQIAVSAPADTVLQNSATAFLQGFYPPAGSQASAQILANGSTVTAPLGGYQLIPISIVSSGAGSEDNSWLQSATACANALTSSNAYYYSDEYLNLLQSTRGFYKSILPVISGTFNETTDTFFNAYTIWDLINVAEIHNSSIPFNDLITADTFHQLFTLANAHEFNLAYNSSSTIRAVSGMTLAGQIVTFLNTSISSSFSNKLGIQFGSYGTFTSFFGLAGLTNPGPSGGISAQEANMFHGIATYASSMAFELFTPTSFTPATSGVFPTAADLRVRFVWHNGSASESSPPTTYPLFGTTEASLPWNDFVKNMGEFSLPDQSSWCVACGNTTGICAGTDAGSNSNGNGEDEQSGGSKISNTVAGVIGAMVALAVVLGVELLVMLLAGLRLVSKKRMWAGRSVANGGSGTAKP